MSTTFARILTIAGVAGTVAGVWLTWIDELTAAQLPWRRLFGWEMEQRTDTFVTSIGLMIVVAAAVALIGAVLPARAPAFVGGLVVLATTVLLFVQEQLFLENGLSADLIGRGAWCTFVASIVILVGSTGLQTDVQRELIQA